ncbi:MAG TPA: hypothetical protein PKE26_05185 [Kiritimatiellia bacterium]|nr:hypothetical protein [Kiritimatiellia bacterium]HMO98486.1 hypothetical protein [Kiritimatiellia bacterium]HMP95794.1 hypothetical protein [Kiritimatiellia bacterium]
MGDDPEKPFRPGLVTALCPDPMKPMEMAPGSRTRDNRNIKGFPAQLFRPESSVDWVIDADRRAKRQFFILYYYRPVARGHIDLLMGRISELDRKRLAIEMDAARMIADMVREAENDDE